MAAHNVRGGASASGGPEVLLVSGEGLSSQDQKLLSLLECLGVSSQVLTAGQLASDDEWNAPESVTRFCVLTSARCLATALAQIPESDFPAWAVKGDFGLV